MKIRIDLKKFFCSLIILSLISVSVYFYVNSRPIKKVYYHSVLFSFRGDVKAAMKIRVYPDERSLHDLFWSPHVENVTIMFKPVDEKMGYYSAEVFELTYKLSLMYMMNGMRKDFNAIPIDSYENIRSSPIILKIVLVHPELTNKTLIEVKGEMVYLYAKDYRDFDLVTIKTIMTAMNVTA